jgi:two-component system sensor histidine kinase HydH
MLATMALSPIAGLLLACSVAWSFVSVQRAARTVVRGDGQRMLSSVEAEVRSLSRRPTEADLEAMLDAHRAEGAISLRLRDPSGLLFAGPERDRASPDPPLGLVFDHGGVATLAVRIAGPGRASRLHRAWDGGSEPPPPRRGPPTLTLALVSPTAAALERNARVTLTLSLVAAALAVLASVAFWRLLRERAEMVKRGERERALASLGEMSAVIAHEIRNPLAALKGHAQLLEESLGEEKLRARAARVLREAVRLESLTADLLSFVRSGALSRRPLDAGAFVLATVDSFGEGVRATVHHGAVEIEMDADRMHEALTNLLRNARQASPETAVALDVRVVGARWRCVIGDRGPGVAPSEREQVFMPFVTTKTHGTGLGLAIARRVVEAHGGRLWCGEREGGGAEFFLELPLRDTIASE